MPSLKGKVIAITGAGSGIGRALALEAAEQGAHLALSDIKQEQLQQTAAMVQRYGVRTSTHVVDVARREEVEAWAAATKQEHGGCDIVINNAGASQEDVHRAHNAASLTSPEQAAEIILRAICGRRPRVLVGWDAVFYDWLTRLLPNMAHRLYAWGARKMAVAR